MQIFKTFRFGRLIWLAKASDGEPRWYVTDSDGYRARHIFSLRVIQDRNSQDKALDIIAGRWNLTISCRLT